MNNLYNKMDYHLNLLNKSVKLTERMIKAAEKENVDSVSEFADSRQTLLDIITKVQIEIESILEQEVGKQEKYFIQKANSWISQTQICIQEITKLDEILLEQLNQVKENTIKEVSTVFKQKESIKGYNLQNVKR